MESEQGKKIRYLVYFGESSQLERVRGLIENENVDINSANILGDAALHTAAASGKLDVVNYLVSNGASVD